MKKLITLFLITGFSVVSLAQTSAQQADGPPIKSDRPEAPSASSDGLKATPFWTETFAGGFPAGWQVLDSSMPYCLLIH